MITTLTESQAASVCIDVTDMFALLKCVRVCVCITVDVLVLKGLSCEIFLDLVVFRL